MSSPERGPAAAALRRAELLEHPRAGPRRGWLMRRLLLVADLAGLSLAFLVAQALFPPVGAYDRFGFSEEIILFACTLPGWIFVARLYRLYDRDEEHANHSTADDLVGVFHMVTVGSWLFLAGAWVTGAAHPTFPKLLTFWAVAILFITTARASARGFCRTRVAYLQNTVVVGAGDVGQLVARKILRHPEYGINLVGFVDAKPKERRDDLGDLTLLGDPGDLPSIVKSHDIERVIIAFSAESHDRTLELIRSLKDYWVQVDIIPRFFEIISPGVTVHAVEGVPLVGLPPFRLSRTSQLLKRTMDIALSGAGLLFLAPLLVVIAIAIKLDSRGPVLFRQTRVGVGNRTFVMYKFRTMVVGADNAKDRYAHLNKHLSAGDARMFKISDDPRVTRVGRFLRVHLLDELPQLINVFRGDMSLVGPRPLIVEEDRHVGGWARRRLDLKPGMTGLWQVLGRSDIPFEEMVKLDYLYVTNWSLGHDFKLLFRTLPLLRYGSQNL
jgi:exopolysaccharide biosynthesis polyprenyl glycosylphosphotransferase